MINKYVFKDKNINLFAPNTNEYLYDYIYILGYSDEASKDWKSRFLVLSVLKYLFNLEIIYVYSWCENDNYKDKVFSINETLNIIDTLWIKDTKYSDYYGMVMFGTQNWYRESLEKLGMTHTTNWEDFVKNNIGDLEEWINKNMPKT